MLLLIPNLSWCHRFIVSIYRAPDQPGGCPCCPPCSHPTPVPCTPHWGPQRQPGTGLGTPHHAGTVVQGEELHHWAGWCVRGTWPVATCGRTTTQHHAIHRTRPVRRPRLPVPPLHGDRLRTERACGVQRSWPRSQTHRYVGGGRRFVWKTIRTGMFWD